MRILKNLIILFIAFSIVFTMPLVNPDLKGWVVWTPIYLSALYYIVKLIHYYLFSYNINQKILNKKSYKLPDIRLFGSVLDTTFSILGIIFVSIIVFPLLKVSSNGDTLIDESDNQGDNSSVVLGEGTTGVSGSRVSRYDTFEEMINSDIGEFKHLKVIVTLDFSNFSYKVICQDLVTKEIVDVVIMKETFIDGNIFDDNQILYLHLTKQDDDEFYMLSDCGDSIFIVTGNAEIMIPSKLALEIGGVITESSFLELINFN